MKYVIVILFYWGCMLFTSTAVAQKRFSIKGKVIDSLSYLPISEVSVSLLTAKDSFLVDYNRTGMDGSFMFKEIPKNNYIILISFPDYAVYTNFLTCKDSFPNIDLNEISIIQKKALLEDVIVKSKISSIKVKGDTLEYNAATYKLHPNATVEELLERLPGIQIDNNGQIKAQGILVKKVLVDGEEFFGDDPTLVTKNLNADLIDKVQIFDKKSDQASFTGIDDGKKERTINLQIKKEKKNGYFGRIEFGGATNQFYQNQALFNLFSGPKKISAYLTQSNTNILGLGYQDKQKLGVTNDNNYLSNNLDKWNGTYEGIGRPKTIAGGVHYDDKWKDNKQSISMNYKIGLLDVLSDQNLIQQNSLPSSITVLNSWSTTNNHLFRQSLNATYNLQIDSFSTIKINLDGQLSDKTTNETDSTFTINGSSQLLNKANTSYKTRSNGKSLNADVIWQKKFRKPRRTLSIDFNTIQNGENYTGYLNNSTVLLIDGFDSIQNINQYKTGDYQSNRINFKAYYTEPISKTISIMFDYSINILNDRLRLYSYNKGNNQLLQIDSVYSNYYTFNKFGHQGGMSLIFNEKKYRLQLSNDIKLYRFSQLNNFNASSLKRYFFNWAPFLLYQYNFSSLKNFRLSYLGTTIQPTIQQLQPISNNRDPLNIYLGNVNLTPFFKHTITFAYFDLKPVSDRTINIEGNYNIGVNPIAINVITDSTGKNTYIYSNINGTDINYNLTAFYEKQLKLLKIGLGTILGINGNNNTIISNGFINHILSNNFNWAVILSKQKTNKYRVQINITPQYNVNKSSLQSGFKNNYWGYTLLSDISLYFIPKVLLHTNVNYTWQQKTEVFNTNLSRLIWNADVTKRFFKKENFSIKLSANDILNENIGFSRTTSNNFISQNSYNTIGRYFLLSAVWNFNRTLKSKE